MDQHFFTNAMRVGFLKLPLKFLKGEGQNLQKKLFGVVKFKMSNHLVEPH